MGQAGRYKIVARLGEGGMAEVFKAIKEGPGGWEKPIALKRILPHFADQPSFIQMLSAEARLHAHLDHPNLVQIIDFFEQEKTFFIAMEFVPGHNLRRILHDAKERKISLPWQAAVHVGTELLKGLDFAHNRRGPQGPLRIVHRDISPQNVLISYDGLVKLSDFGIAKGNIDRENTETGVLKGKHRYLSPEQLEPKSDVDHRSDLFSLGVLLYEVILDRHPFEAATEFETMKRIAAGQYASPQEVRSNLPTPICEALQASMNPRASDRFQSAGDFRSALLAGQEHSWVASGPEFLKKWMIDLYPIPSDREPQPLELTPILSRHGTPLPPVIESRASLISGVAEISLGGARRKTVRPIHVGGAAAGAALLLTAYGLYTRNERAEPAPLIVPPTEAPVSTPIVETTAIEPLREAPVKRTVLGSLVVETVPGASIVINGKRAGTAPLGPISLTRGSYLVLVAVPGKAPVMSRVQIESGKTHSLKVSGRR